MRGSSLAAGFMLVLSSALISASSYGGAVGTAAREADGNDGKQKKPLSDAQIRQLLIDESIAAYDGSCPCPYSTARNGSRCGRRSAYSRPGGEAPLCYAKDVSTESVKEYREGHPGA
ncbi:MAG: hypothetical protein ABI488_07245 [Polyangiaceae bacterium]